MECETKCALSDLRQSDSKVNPKICFRCETRHNGRWMDTWAIKWTFVDPNRFKPMDMQHLFNWNMANNVESCKVKPDSQCLCGARIQQWNKEWERCAGLSTVTCLKYTFRPKIGDVSMIQTLTQHKFYSCFDRGKLMTFHFLRFAPCLLFRFVSRQCASCHRCQSFCTAHLNALATTHRMRFYQFKHWILFSTCCKAQHSEPYFHVQYLGVWWTSRQLKSLKNRYQMTFHKVLYFGAAEQCARRHDFMCIQVRDFNGENTEEYKIIANLSVNNSLFISKDT